MTPPGKMKLSIEQTLLDSRVSIDAPIAQEWPVRPMFVHTIPIHFCHHDFFAIDRTFRDDLSIRATNKTLPPEFNSIAPRRRLMANAVCRSDVTAIRDCVAPLNCFPGRILRCAEFFFLRWMPADCRWIKNNLRATQRG